MIEMLFTKEASRDYESAILFNLVPIACSSLIWKTARASRAEPSRPAALKIWEEL